MAEKKCVIPIAPRPENVFWAGIKKNLLKMYLMELFGALGHNPFVFAPHLFDYLWGAIFD